MKAWRILLVENEEDDYILTRQMLSEARGSQFELRWVTSYDEAMAAVQEEAFDAVLVDYQLDDHDGLELVRALTKSGSRLPMILLTGYGSYDIDLESMRAGASDYLSKGEASAPLLERAIRYAIEHKSSEEALRQARDELEGRVHERTEALAQANLRLEAANAELVAEIAERQRVEDQLRAYSARIKALGEFSRRLSEITPEYQDVLDSVCQQVTEQIGDACVVTLLTVDGNSLQTACVFDPDPMRLEALRQGVSKFRSMDEGMRSSVVQSGQSVRITEYAGDHGGQQIFSLMIVPMLTQGRVIGTLGVSRNQPGRPYRLEDQRFLEELAARSALAIDNARYFHGMQAELQERKRVEAELAEIQRRMLDGIEGERLQLAQELHDGPVQELYALMYQVSALADQISPGQAASIKANLKHVIQSLRVISGELRPPTLAPFGLEKAIRSQVEQIQHTHPNLKFDLRLEQDGTQLPERVRLALFRILQVALTNVLRHAHAGSVRIRFDLDSQQACLEISDDGCGFDVPGRMIEMARQGHFGLVGANERAAAVGGRLTLESTPGKGTTLRVVVPRLVQENPVSAARP